MILDIDMQAAYGAQEYKKDIKPLAGQLEELQHVIKSKQVPVLIVFEGWSAAGKGEIISEVLAPLDPRFYSVKTMYKLTEDAKMRPFLWEFAQNAPLAGRIMIFDKSWHRIILPESVEQRKLTELEKDGFYHDINAFEKQLSDSGTLIIKIFLHISKDEQKRRFAEMEKDKDTRWRVTDRDLKQNKEYDKNIKLFDKMLEQSSFGENVWSVVAADNRNFAIVRTYQIIIDKINEELERRELSRHVSYVAPKNTPLADVDLNKTIGNNEYNEKLLKLQTKIAGLGYKLYAKRRSVVVLYEGWDAAGKGGNIQRLTHRLDPRGYEVVPISAPTREELDHHYLWRFWKNLPKDGHTAVFDRTWYGRVLVERVEGFCSEDDWKRAYKEINDFEKHLVNHGTIIFKFWLHIDKTEQLARFNAREADPLKRFKITDEDWRNREKWDLYETAVNEMIEKTSTDYAPWEIVEGNDKRFARIKVLETFTKELEKRLK